MNVKTIDQKIKSQMKNCGYTPKYITISSLHKRHDAKFKELGLTPMYDDTLNEQSVFVT